MTSSTHHYKLNFLIVRSELIKAFAAPTAHDARRPFSNTGKLQRRTELRVTSIQAYPQMGPDPERDVVQVVQRTPQATDQVTAQAETLRTSLLQDQDAALGMPTDQVADQVERAPCQAWLDRFNTLPKP